MNSTAEETRTIKVSREELRKLIVALDHLGQDMAGALGRSLHERLWGELTDWRPR